MTLIKNIINRRVTVSMLFLALTGLGIIAYRNLPLELYPNAELPMLIVRISSRVEVDPAYMENQGVIPLEGVIGTLEGIERLASTAEQRRGIIYVYYSQSVSIKFAYLKLQEKVDLIKDDLPEEFTVTVDKADREQMSNQFMGLQVLGSGGIDRVRQIVDLEITSELQNIDGIAGVNVFGGREKSVEIILDAQACDAYNITPNQVRNALRQNSLNKIFVGQVHDPSKQYPVHVTAEYKNISDLEGIVLRRQGPVLLSHVADLFVGVKEETSYSRVNGKDAVTLMLMRDNLSNLIALSHSTQNAIKNLNARLKPHNVEIVIRSNPARLMEDNMHDMIVLAIQGGLLAVLILWIFLRNFRLVIIITLAIPISIFTAFFLFYLAGITLNSLTLVGMVLAIGMLLDNSVVVLENIYRLKSLDRDHETAVVQGTQEVWRSIMAATLTTITVFLPFLFAEDFVTRLIGQHVGVSIISTLMVSLIVALLLIPMFAYDVLQKTRTIRPTVFQKVSQHQRFIQIYTVLLKTGLRFPARTLITAGIVFFLALFFSLATGVDTLREVDTGEIDIYITMPGGSTLESTDVLVRELESRLENLEEKETLTASVYEEEAVLTIALKEDYYKIGKRSLAAIKEDLEDQFGDIQTAEIAFEESSAGMQMGGGGMRGNSGSNLERMLGIGIPSERVIIRGNDFAQMRNVADDIQYYMEDLSSIRMVRQNVSDSRPEMHLFFDPHMLSRYDIALSDVASELNTFQNEFSANLVYKIDNEEVDIVIRNGAAGEETDKTLNDLENLDIQNADGVSLKMQELSRIVFGSGLSRIQRVNQEKQIEIMVRFEDEVNKTKDLLEAARHEVEDLIAGLTIPSGIAVAVVHEEDDFSAFYLLIGAAFLLIYMILAAVFESLLMPIVILFSIPLAAIGSLLVLIITGNALFNANTLMGFLILLGVVVNNGIIYLDYTRILKKRGFRQTRALLVAGQARIRPILITAITTIAAMLPMAMSKEPYVANIGAPFAITLIGGLSLSTLFTLVIIPTLYSGLESAIAWLKQLSLKFKGVQLALILAGSLLIHTQLDDMLWQMAAWVILILAVPATLFFILTSLRRANTKMIGPDEPITIRIRNLVKIYDRSSRFVREWNQGKIITRHAGMEKPYRKLGDFHDWIWQLPLFIFMLWFGLIYLNSPPWIILITVGTYLFGLTLFMHVDQYLKHRIVNTEPRIPTSGLFFWIFPTIALTTWFFKWNNLPAVILLGTLWHLALAISKTSERLDREQVNINRLTGRFADVRRMFYQFVLLIPIIGKKRTPFRALNQVSMEIGNGMFGLLGPNGAGKTTLMRIICGIFEQSTGKIRINGLDTLKYREELQGLIGYLPQEFGTYENMSACEFLHYQAILKNMTDKQEREERVQQVLKSVNMDEKQHSPIGSFSGGMKQRIGIAQILLHLPRILVVDEPTAGLDPWERIRFRNLLVELSRERIVIFSTHIIEDISSSCSRVAVLNRGNLRYFGSPVDMTRSARGKVWQCHVLADQFDSFRKEYQVVHHMRDGGCIRVRCISEDKPHPEAESVNPTLEDAYLYLLKDKK